MGLSRMEITQLLGFVRKDRGPGVRLVLNDDGFLPYWIAEQLRALPGVRFQMFSGEGELEAWKESLGTQSLFGERTSSLLHLTKCAPKRWGELGAFLGSLPKDPGTVSYVVLPSALRTGLGDVAVPAMITYLPATGAGGKKLVHSLLGGYPALAKGLGPEGGEATAELALAIYGNHYSEIDRHFRRMEATGLGFEETLGEEAGTNVFDVVDACAKGDWAALSRRLEEVKGRKDDLSALLAALGYFLRQLVDASAPGGLQRVPLPSQERVSNGLRRISPAARERFFFALPMLELAAREQTLATEVLAQELLRLLGP